MNLFGGVYGPNELFTDSREFCSGLTACVFLVVFRLAVKFPAALRLGLLKFGWRLSVTVWGVQHQGQRSPALLGDCK